MPPMDHAQASLLVPDFARGSLSDPERIEVEAHLVSCTNCRDLAGGYTLISDTLRYLEPAVSMEHPASDAIVAFALRTGALRSEELLSISAHVRGCAPCAEDVEATQRTGEAAGTVQPIRDAAARRFQWSSFIEGPRLAALAAGITVAVLGYPAYLGLRTTPRLMEEVNALRSEQGMLRGQVSDLNRSVEEARRTLTQATSWSGAVDYLLLLGQARSSVEVETLRIQRGQPYAPIAIQPAAPAGEAARPHRIEIIGQDGTSAWSWRTTGGELRRHLGLSDTILLHIPTASLAAGQYTLRVVPEAGTDLAPLLEQRFRVVQD